MRQLLREKGILFGIFILFYTIIQAILFAWLSFRIIPQYFIIDFLLIVGLSSIIFLIKSNKLTIIYLSIIYTLALTIFLINATMYKVYFEIFTLQQLQLVGEAVNVFEFKFLSLSSIIVGTIVSIIYLISMIYAYKKIQRRHIEMPNYYSRAVLLFLVTIVIVFTFFESNITAVSQYESLTTITTLKRASLQKYGIMGYYTKEAQNIISLENDDVDPSDTDEVNNYDSIPTDYFGLLKGYNVIEIMIETGQSLAINEELTPNLYELMNDGLSFPNNYSENKTNVSEMIGITGSYPSINFQPDLYNYDLSFSLPNRLNDEYQTSYFHNNLPSFYKRGDLMPQLGFENIYLHDDLFPGVPIYDWSGNYPLDSDCIDQIIPHIDSSQQPFYSYWTTLSSHGPYYNTYKYDNIDKTNVEKFQEMGLWSKVVSAEHRGVWVNPVANSTPLNINRMRFYECAIMDLDIAVGKLINALKAAGEFDNTLFVFYGDHDIYYHNLNLTMYHTTEDEYYRMEMYKAALFMYNPVLNQTYREANNTDSGVIDKFVTPYNIVPTILDLLGMRYNTSLYLADSVFADTDDVFYSNKIAGLFNQYFYSDDGQTVIYQTDDATEAEKGQFLEDCQIILEKLDYINTIYNGVSTPKE